MESISINQNIYKFSNSLVIMTKINDKDISKLSIKELEKYLDELDDWYRIRRGEEDIKAGRLLSEDEVYDYFRKKCQEK